MLVNFGAAPVASSYRISALFYADKADWTLLDTSLRPIAPRIGIPTTTQAGMPGQATECLSPSRHSRLRVGRHVRLA